jgi:hypothetical protein
MKSKQLLVMFSTVSVILVAIGISYAIFGLGILPVGKAVLLHWESSIYGAIMIGWGTTLFLIGRIAFRKNDTELMKALLYGLIAWLIMEALFSAFLGVWFNVGVCVVVLMLFGFPLLKCISTLNKGKLQPQK